MIIFSAIAFFPSRSFSIFTSFHDTSIFFMIFFYLENGPRRN